MTGQRFAHYGSEAADQVENPGGKTGFFDQFGQHEGVQRSDFARLENHRATGRQGRDDFGDDLVQRIVPGSDASHHADRLAHHQRIADRLFESVFPQQFDDALQHRAGESDLNALGHLERHAEFAGNGAGQLVAAGGQPPVQGFEVLGPLLDGSGGPAVKGAAGGGDRRPGILGAAGGNPSHDLFGRGVDDIDTLPPTGRPPAIDVKLFVVLHGLS